MQMRVIFKWDGFIGAYDCDVNESGLDAYTGAMSRFWEHAQAEGACVVEGPRSAWDHVPIYHGPQILTVGGK